MRTIASWRSSPVLLAAALALLAWLSGCGGRPAPMPVTEPVAADLRVIEHRVLPGETLARIADNYYGDPALAGQIARDNGLSDSGQVAEGSLLSLRFGPDQWDRARRRASALEAYNRGVDQLGQQRLAEAEKQFLLALDTAPDLLAARYNLALVHLRRGRNEEALVQLEELTSRRPDDTDFRFARGSALFQLTRFEEAAAQFNLILQEEPDHRRAAFGLARSLQADGHDRQAIAAWERYLELDSTSSWAETARQNLRKLRDDGGR